MHSSLSVIQKMMSKRVQMCEPGGGPQQMLTIQTEQYRGRPNLGCPRRQLDILRRSATSSEPSAWIFPGEEWRKLVSQMSHKSLLNNWAQGRKDFPSILGGTRYLCFYVSNWFLINIKRFQLFKKIVPIYKLESPYDLIHWEFKDFHLRSLYFKF